MSGSTLKDSIALMRGEGSHESYIPFSSVIAPGVVMCRSGELIATFQAKGIAFETVDDASIEQAINNLNILYRTISRSDYAVQIHRLRRPMSDELTPCALSPALPGICP